jgi:hypothetical protein
MDRNNRHKTCVICVVMLATFSCQSQSLRDYKNELSWKQDWVSRFFLDYRKYQEKILPDCAEPNRDISFDIERKMRGLGETPFAAVTFTVKKYIKINNFKFDSIVMINIHDPLFEGEFTFPPVYFYIIKNDLIQELVVNVDDDKKCSILKPLKKVDQINILGNVSPGCGYGYVSYTKFDQKWAYHIQNIIINPDE